MIPVSITVAPPPLANLESVAGGGKGKRGRGKKGPQKKKEVTVEFELHQDLDGLRNRAGDTGQCPMRVAGASSLPFLAGDANFCSSPPSQAPYSGESGNPSSLHSYPTPKALTSPTSRPSLHLAKLLLTQHHFPPSTPLFPDWSTSTLLELGSGTGFLGLALRGTTAHWTYSDQLVSLSLLVKNLRKNHAPIDDSTTAVRELDWVVERDEGLRRGATARQRRSSAGQPEAAPPDLIIAADCIYNPALSGPLAYTIDHVAGPETLVLVASELRDEEPLELFLREWRERGWEVARAVFEEEVMGWNFVVWVGWRKGRRGRGEG